MSRHAGLAVVGVGFLGRFHAANIAGAVASAGLVRVCDTSEATASSAGDSLGVEWTTSYDELLHDDAVEGVVIATPTSTHPELIIQAARAGKHVFTEKPISLDVESTVAAIEATEAAGVHLQVGFHRRFDPDWCAVEQRIRTGDLGEVRFLRSSQRDMRPPQSTSYLATDGDFFVDALIHDLDSARWLAGEIAEVSSLGASLTSPMFAEAGDVDYAIVTLRFRSGALGVIDGSRAAGYGYEASTEVLGSLATARISRGPRHHIEWLTPGASTRDHVTDFRERHAIAYVAELEHFARAIREGFAPATGGDHALAAFVLASAAARSRREQRSVLIEREALARKGTTP